MTMKTQPWQLHHTTQCAKCPWRKDSNPLDIPNGYSIEKHAALRSTIADVDNPFYGLGGTPLHVMACHETDEAHCLGWLMHQLGPGNNIALRLRMLNCTNAADIRLRGDQHDTFEDTLPSRRKKRRSRVPKYLGPKLPDTRS